jgi:hypothetical protein
LGLLAVARAVNNDFEIDRLHRKIDGIVAHGI